MTLTFSHKLFSTTIYLTCHSTTIGCIHALLFFHSCATWDNDVIARLHISHHYQVVFPAHFYKANYKFNAISIVYLAAAAKKATVQIRVKRDHRRTVDEILQH